MYLYVVLPKLKSRASSRSVELNLGGAWGSKLDLCPENEEGDNKEEIAWDILNQSLSSWFMRGLVWVVCQLAWEPCKPLKEMCWAKPNKPMSVRAERHASQESKDICYESILSDANLFIPIFLHSQTDMWHVSFKILVWRDVFNTQQLDMFVFVPSTAVVF